MEINDQVIQVDDIDNRIEYTDGWLTGGTQYEFGGTTHGTQSAGAKANFTFTGTSVVVFGTIANDHASHISSTSTYSIDGSDPVEHTTSPGKDTQYRQQFYNSSYLSNGTHTLVITSTTAHAPFWLDYFEINVPIFASTSAQAGTSSAALTITPQSPTVTPQSPAVTRTTFVEPPASTTGPARTSPSPQNTLVTIDDTDSRIIYVGPWSLDGGPAERQNTVHGTVEAGATATLAFTGSSVSVYGTITEIRPGAAARLSNYSIDGAPLAVVTPSPANSVLYQQLFFQSPTLQYGQHTLIVTAGAGDLPLLLDFFQVNTSSSVPSPSGVTTATLGPSSLSTYSGSSSHTGAIVGGLIGGLLFVGLVAFVVFRFRQRRKVPPPPPFVLTIPDPDWTPGPTWTNEKLTMRHHGGV